MRLREYCGTSSDKTLSNRTPHDCAVNFSMIGAVSGNGSSASSRPSRSSACPTLSEIGKSVGITTNPIGYNHALFRGTLAKRHAKQTIENHSCRFRVAVLGMQPAPRTNRRDQNLVSRQIILGGA